MENEAYISGAQRLRAEICNGRFSGPTAGMARGVAQANLIILPMEEAAEFHRFCLANPKPCPLLEVARPWRSCATFAGFYRRPEDRCATVQGV